MQLNKKALVIGEIKDCLECMKYLLQRNWEIFAVVSNDAQVINWCSENSISIIPLSKVKTLEEEFYLFSFISTYSIPDFFSINQKYVIFNNEEMRIFVKHNEIDFSLNLKCAEAGPIIFKKITDQIEKSALNQMELNYLNSLINQEQSYKNELFDILNKAKASLKMRDYKAVHIDDQRDYVNEVSLLDFANAKRVLALIYLALARFFRKPLLISQYFNNTDIPENLREQVERRGFMYICKQRLTDGFLGLINYLENENKIYTISRDFFQRYNLDVLTDIAIIMGEVGVIDNHRLIIKLTNEKVIIKGKSLDRELIDGLVSWLGTVFSYSSSDLQDLNLKKLSILNDSQKQLFNDWNTTEKPYPNHKTICELFEEQVEKFPNRVALIYENCQLSYRELNNKSNQLATYLRNTFQIKPDDLIALYLDRSELTLIAILAVLKSGGAYVPIDPNYPKSRVAYILDDIKAKVILTNEQYHENLASIIYDTSRILSTEILMLDTHATQNLLLMQQSSNLPGIATNHHLAYVIYTSGTTGKPKGVMIEHSGVVSLIHGLLEKYKIGNNEKFILFANYVFDASVEQINLALFSGNEIHIVSSEHITDLEYFANYITTHKITHLHGTPSFLANLAPEKLIGLNRLIFGGEVLSNQVLVRYSSFVKTIINEYGPTETTVTSLVAFNSCYIGKPVNNTQIFVLDGDQNLLPLGAIGELHIAGVQLARGYLNLPKLSAEKFLLNPFQNEKEKELGKNNRLYKTGDLVRYLSTGEVEYIARNDSQIKLRGYRIELKEIESVLLFCPGVKQVAVLVRDYSDNSAVLAESKCLEAYLITDNSDEQLKQQIFVELKKKLPYYMIPSDIIFVPSFPLNSNGKLDVDKLRKLNQKDKFYDQQHNLKPATQLEKQLLTIWQEILGFENIAVDAPFFSIGGHSLSAMKLVKKIENILNKTIKLSEIFHYQTIQQQAELIFKRSNSAKSQVFLINSDKQNRFEPFPLTDIQQAYFFGRMNMFSLGGIRSHTYIENEFSEINIQHLEIALNRLILLHEMLRVIILEDGTQKILNDTPHYRIQTSDENVVTTRQSILQKFKKSNPWPLFEVRATHLDAGKIVIHFYFDLLIVDAISLQILFNDLSFFYTNEKEITYAPTISYRDVVLQLKKSELSIDRAKSYWLERIDSLPAAPELPTCLIADNQSPHFVRREGSLSQDEWQLFQKASSHMLVTPAVLLATIYGEILRGWSKSAHFTLNVMFFNRTVLPNTENIVGNLSTTLLLEMDLRGNATLKEKAKKIQERLLHDLEYSEFNGIKVLNELNRRKGGVTSATMPVVFACALNLQSKKNFSGPNLFKWYGKHVSYSQLETPQVWLDHQVIEEEDGSFHFIWDVREGYFQAGVIETMFNMYQNYLRTIARDLGCNFIPLLPENHRVLITEVNNAKIFVPHECLHSAIFEQAKIHPEKLALITRDCKLSYFQMITTALLLKEKLLEQSLFPNDIVAIIMEKGWQQIIAILAVHAAGAAYVPIDPTSLPIDRIVSILKLSQAKAIVAQLQLTFDPELPVYFVTDINNTNEYLYTPIPAQKPTDLAYLIFTSGSTGQPKGVMIQHHAALNTIETVNRNHRVTSSDRAFAISSLSFDLSVFDIFGLLRVGGSIYIPTGEELKTPQNWLDIITSQKITLWNSAPALMQLFMDHISHNSKIPSMLRLVLLSGDWIPLKLPDRIRQCFSSEIISLGGATEASIWSIYYSIDQINPNWTSIPYGKALANQSMHVLDENLEPRPVWATGMIHIGGSGLAKGYFRDVEKTRQSFFAHPKTKELLYKTGDLGRFLPDGNIEFLGREDFQVKVQGYRIELGEIEYAIYCSVTEISQTVVCVVGEKSETKKIAAFFVSKVLINIESLKKSLAKILPSYMMPNYFVQPDVLPLNQNGKIDKKLLLDLLDLNAQQASTNWADPETALEKGIAKIWGNLLGIKRVGRHDNFFKLGGTSFVAFQMINAVQRELGFSISFSTLFQKSTIAQLAESSSIKSDSPLVILQDKNRDNTIFFVHPSGGGVLCYTELSILLSKNWSFYAFQAPGYMGTGQNVFRTVEEMASFYLDILLKTNAKAPFWVGGWSFGGVVAYEMTRQLKMKGYLVNPVLLIDAPAPIIQEKIPEPILRRWFAEDYGDSFHALDEETKNSLFTVFQNNIHASTQYYPPVEEIDIIQMKAVSVDLEQLKHHPGGSQDDWGWKLISSGRVISYLFDANHTSIIQKQNAEKLAHQILQVTSDFSHLPKNPTY